MTIMSTGAMTPLVVIRIWTKLPQIVKNMFTTLLKFWGKTLSIPSYEMKQNESLRYHIFVESIQDSTDWSDIKEGYRSSQNLLAELFVNVFGGTNTSRHIQQSIDGQNDGQSQDVVAILTEIVVIDSLTLRSHRTVARTRTRTREWKDWRARNTSAQTIRREGTE